VLPDYSGRAEGKDVTIFASSSVVRNAALASVLFAVAASIGTLFAASDASANACAASCRAQHNQCRISTKGSPSCDAALQRCLQGCLRR